MKTTPHPCGWLVGWLVLRWCVPSFVCAFVSAFVCSFRGLFACVLSWVEIYIPTYLPTYLNLPTGTDQTTKPAARACALRRERVRTIIFTAKKMFFA